jgi:hypothetical protein
MWNPGGVFEPLLCALTRTVCRPMTNKGSERICHARRAAYAKIERTCKLMWRGSWNAVACQAPAAWVTWKEEAACRGPACVPPVYLGLA